MAADVDKATYRKEVWRRSAQILLIGLLVCSLGWVLAKLVFLAINLLMPDSEEPAKWVAGVVGITSMLALIKEGADAVPQIWDYIRTGERKSRSAFEVFLLTSFTTLSLIWMLGVNSPSVKEPVPAVFFISPCANTVSEERSAETDSALATFVVPFYDEADYDKGKRQFTKGTEINAASKEFIDHLGIGFAACGASGAPVRLEVRGYCSSSNFSKWPNSDSLNVNAANERARHIADELRVSAKSGNVHVTERQWSSLKEMRLAILFNDSTGKQYDSIKGLLNRRTEIRLLSAGDCALEKVRSLTYTRKAK